MSWDDLNIPDLEDIPANYFVNWQFINSFIIAFQERADYIEGANRASTYDGLVFTNAQISSSDFRSRLLAFNSNVRSCFNAQWVKEDTWDQMGTFTTDTITIGGGAGSRFIPGMGLIDIIPWDETELRLLLTDEVYDDIFTTYTYDINFKPSYWSGLYKLVKYVMLFRTLSIANDYNPTRNDPVLVLNDSESLSKVESGLDLDGLITEAINSPNTANQSFNNFIMDTALNYISRWNGLTHSDQCRISYNSVTTDPFCQTPTLMDIRTVLWRDLGNFLTTTSEEDDFFGNVEDSRLERSWSEPFSGSELYEVIGGVTQTPVLTGTPSGYRAENRNFPVSHSGGNTSIDIAGLTDLRFGYDFTVTQAPTTPFGSEEKAGQFVNYYLNYATCELPQDDFIFSIEPPL